MAVVEPQSRIFLCLLLIVVKGIHLCDSLVALYPVQGIVEFLVFREVFICSIAMTLLDSYMCQNLMGIALADGIAIFQRALSKDRGGVTITYMIICLRQQSIHPMSVVLWQFVLKRA